jgi:quinohemoprotein ethanol dehydrogenase
MKLKARRYCSAQFVTRFMYKSDVAGVAIAILAAICCGTNASAEEAGGQVLSPQRIQSITSAIDGEAIIANAKTTKDWLSYGLDYSETRFSKLTEINTGNVKNLGLKWTYNLESVRGVEATPLVVDGIMYVTASWSVVHAVDVRTGKRIWTYDPQVPRTGGYKGCCDVVNRGVALYKGKVFVASYDGRLVAIDAATGKKVWEKDTITDHSHSYTVTGAPRVVKGKVLIGNGGAEFGVRGYLTAYDAETGEQAWRWFVVPGDPSKPYEDASMEAAAKTWDPAGKYWINGGGGTPWDTIAYDPELNLVYIGTGNGAPWNRKLRSPSGGDNLYLASIVALNPDTGQYVWHYQETPGDNWDYTSTQPIILATIPVDGQPRKVILHAPKNGFFYVIDRINGKFISAKNYVDVNWATGYDANGRPIEVPESRGDQPFDAIPDPHGATNWMPLSYNPITGYAYIPAQHVPMTLTAQKEWKHNASVPGVPMSGLGWNLGYDVNAVPPKSKPFGRLIAWDPVKQAQVWKQDYASPWNGGTLTTAGNLVFQGTADGRFVAYNAKTGEKLWESSTGTGVVAGPATYEVDGTQYVSVAVGWGGVYGESARATDKEAPGTVFTFAIGGKAPLPEFRKYQSAGLLQGIKYDPANVGPGMLLYVSHCGFCHGVPGVDKGGNIKNLGYVPAEEIANLKDILFKGPFLDQGMPDFTGKLSEDDVVKIQAFIQGTADTVRSKK